MIFRQTADHLFQRDETGRGHGTRLSHRAPDTASHLARFVDEIAAATQKRAYRGAQSLRNAEHHRIDVFAVLRRGDAVCHAGIEHARSVHVDVQPVFAGGTASGLDLLRQPGIPAAVVVAVLDAQQTGFAACCTRLLHEISDFV